MIKLKFVVLFTAIATLISAVPLNPGIKSIIDSSKEYKVEPTAGKLNDRSFRLPNNTEPISYDIRLGTDIHRGDFGFEGEVRIKIRAVEATDSITLHSRQTIITGINLLNPNGTIFEANRPFTYDSEVEFLVIPVSRGLEAGQEIVVFIEYLGFLRSDLQGFFRTSYNNPATDQVTWLATTQFQPINARHAFPCYDEIRYRRPINLQIRHHQNYSAISNMPVAEVIEDGEFTTTVFEQTLPIPVFVLAFTVSDFDFVSNATNPNVEYRVYGRPSAIAAGQGDDGLILADLFLRSMESLFNATYSLPKSDQIAIPEFASDGALNWGLITHREDIILRFNNDSEAQLVRDIRTAHEYAHIFFANLVAPSSWAYLWLNEGLATLYEIVLNDIRGTVTNNLWQRFLINYYDTAISIDVQGLVPALNNYVEAPQDIRNKFDFITYNKAAVILRMIGDAITRSTFEKGLSYYLADRQLENASPEDVYAGLQRSYDEDNPGRALNITSIMSPWFDLAGFPVLTVRRNGDGITLQQEGFRTLHNELFSIPINYATRSQPNFNQFTARFFLTTSELEVSQADLNITWNDDDWIVFNIGDSSYYVTNYDDELWDRIIDGLNNDHEIIHFFNRGTFFADFHRFIAQDFNISATRFLRLMESLPLEFDSHVWSRASAGLEIIEIRLRGSELHLPYLNYVQELMSQVYGERSFDDRRAMNLINEWSCISGVQQCVTDAHNALIEVLETGATDFEFDYQCNALRTANETIWRNFYDRTVDSNTTEDRSADLTGLLCTEDLNLLRFYLTQVLNTTNNLLTAERALILTTAVVQNDISTYALIELIERDLEAVASITEVLGLIIQLATVTNNYIQAERVMSLIYYLPEVDDELVDLIIQSMQPNLNFLYRNFTELFQWLNGRASKIVQS